MATVCKICWTWCQGCGRKCKCGWWANMISAVNSVYDLGMSVDLIKENVNNIYNWKRVYTAVEIFDHLVNGVELPERKKPKMAYVEQSYINNVKNFKPRKNPSNKCVYREEGDDRVVTVWDRCIYCNNVKHYAPDICPSFNLEENTDDNSK